MVNRHLVLGFLLVVSTLACAPPAPPSAPARASDPCRGSSFDADAPPRACMVKSEHPRRVPAPEALKLRVLEPATIRSGQQASFTLEMKNVTPAPVTVDFLEGCLNWDTQAADGKHATFDSECGGLCGTAPETLRVTLEPGGVVLKRVSLTAIMRRVSGDSCKEETLGPLPPGPYTMTVTLPWADPKPIPGNDQAHASRVFDTRVVVTP